MNSKQKFEKFASSLGMTTSSKRGTCWYDFEEFLIDGITIADTNVRLFTSLSIIFKYSANILSLNKLLKIAQIKFDHGKQWKILGYMLQMASKKSRNKTQWSKAIYKTMSKIKKKNEKLFSLPLFKKDKELLEWGLLSAPIERDFDDKYLHLPTFRKHPLIKARFQGVKAVYSDLSFYKAYHSDEISLRKLSQILHHDTAQIFEANHNLKFIDSNIFV